MDGAGGNLRVVCPATQACVGPSTRCCTPCALRMQRLRNLSRRVGSTVGRCASLVTSASARPRYRRGACLSAADSPTVDVKGSRNAMPALAPSTARSRRAHRRQRLRAMRTRCDGYLVHAASATGSNETTQCESSATAGDIPGLVVDRVRKVGGIGARLRVKKAPPHARPTSFASSGRAARRRFRPARHRRRLSGGIASANGPTPPLADRANPFRSHRSRHKPPRDQLFPTRRGACGR